MATRSSDKTKRQRVLERRVSLRAKKKLERDANREAWLAYCEKHPTPRLQKSIRIRARTVLQFMEGTAREEVLVKAGLYSKDAIGNYALTPLGKQVLERAKVDPQVAADLQRRRTA